MTGASRAPIRRGLRSGTGATCEDPQVFLNEVARVEYAVQQRELEIEGRMRDAKNARERSKLQKDKLRVTSAVQSPIDAGNAERLMLLHDAPDKSRVTSEVQLPIESGNVESFLQHDKLRVASAVQLPIESGNVESFSQLDKSRVASLGNRVPKSVGS